MGNQKFSNNPYLDEPLFNRNDLRDISAFINITQAESNTYARDAKQT